MSPSNDLESLPTETIDPAVIAIYSSLIGELLYIAINTVPQISYVTSALTRYMTRATEAHLKYAKHVLRYLKGVMDRRTTWCADNFRDPHKRREIWACADSSHAYCKPTRMSTMAYGLFCSSTTQFSRGNLACRQLLQHPRVRQSSWPIARALARCCMRAS